jgi:selenocysteine lyase/cysteine desulfurase
VFAHNDQSRNETIKETLEERSIHIAERDGKLRISPHLYNTPNDIAAALDVLSEFA